MNKRRDARPFRPAVTAIAVAAFVLSLGVTACRNASQPPPADEHASMNRSAPSGAGVDHAAMDHAAMPAGSSAPDPRDPRSDSRSPSMPGDMAVTLTPEMMERAGIKTGEAVKGTATGRIHVPGVVAPNAYKEATVTSLVSGRITQVKGELGQRVTAGDSLATVYSPEMADAQTAFIAARSEQQAHAQRQTRTQRLFAIGAVSRQELELVDADRAKMDAAVETARARLALLGIPEDRSQRLSSPGDVVTTFEVKAPMAGVITKRGVNMGVLVDPMTPLFTIVDLESVWVIADLYERDFARVRVGSPATVTTASYPDLTLRGQVSYIDPEVQIETRTAKLRVEVGNAGSRLRFGMFVDVSLGESSTGPVVFVPASAVQLVGSRSIVYLASHDHPGRFVERAVGSPGTELEFAL